MKKNIGLDVTVPENKCNDRACPFHGMISLRGKQFSGKVVKDAMAKTVTVEWEQWSLIRKYERFRRKLTRLKAHNPPCINAKTGDIVRIFETRPISKTKNFVVIEIIKK